MPTLSAVLATLDAEAGGNFAARLVADEPMDNAYHLATYLPEELRETYEVEAGAMSIVATMSGLTGMDSSYAPGGAVTASKFLEESAKFTLDVPLAEKTIREIQRYTQRMLATGGDATERMVSDLSGFVLDVLLKGHRDTAEYLRAQALFNGAIDHTFNGKTLTVDYGIPAANKPNTRTGTAAYDKAASTFWADVRLGRKQLGANRVMIANRDTFYGIVDNDANAIRVEAIDSQVGDSDMVERYRLTKRVGDAAAPSDDVRDSVEFVVYENSGSKIDPVTRSVQAVSFVPDGKVAIVGTAERRAFRPGRIGPDLQAGRIGYHHVAPTTENNGTPGRWARVMKPELAEYEIRGRSASNELPVIEAPDKLVILSTEIGA